MTNGDRIRSMSNEELTTFLSNIRENGGILPISGFCCTSGGCQLRAECEEAGTCILDDNDEDIRWWLSQEEEA